MAYNGQTYLISGLKQKNNGNFPLVDAKDIYVDDNTRLDAKLDELEAAIETAGSGDYMPAPSTAGTDHQYLKTNSNGDPEWANITSSEVLVDVNKTLSYELDEINSTLDEKLDEPATTGTEGQVLQINSGNPTWLTLETSDIEQLDAKLTSINNSLNSKLDKPSATGTNGQFLKTGSNGNEWAKIDSTDIDVGNNKSLSVKLTEIEESIIPKPPTSSSAGQVLKATSNQGTEWSSLEAPTQEQVTTAVNAWMNDPDHISDRALIDDGMISYDKLDNNLKGYMNGITSTEASNVASAAHVTGTYFIYNGMLYQAIADIAIGENIVTSGSGRNCIEVTSGLSEEICGTNSRINDMWPEFGASAYQWALNKSITSSGVSEDSNGFATTTYMTANAGDTIVNTTSGYGYNDKITDFYVHEYSASYTWLRRVRILPGKTHTISSDCANYRIVYGYASSQSVTITREMLDTYFSCRWIYNTPQKLDNKSPAICRSASGTPFAVYDGAEGMPLNRLTVEIGYTQSGSGDPSSENIRPITGKTSVTITHRSTDKKSPVVNGIVAENSGDIISSTGEHTSAFVEVGDFRRIYWSIYNNTDGYRYRRFGEYDKDKNFIGVKNNNTTAKNNYYTTWTTLSANTAFVRVSGPRVDYVYLFKDTYAISFPAEAGTVFGGVLDALAGTLTVTHAQIASYNGEEINEPWVSDRDVYQEGATPTTGAQVVYPLTTPLVYQVTPITILTHKGENVIESDAGSVSAEYAADTMLYIEGTNAQVMIAPTEASSTASVVHVKDSYFIYEGTLHQATADITIGDTIVTSGTGANCKTVPGGLGGDVSELKSSFNRSIIPSGRDLIFNSNFTDTTNVSYTVDSETGAITVTNNTTGIYNCLQTPDTWAAYNLTPGKTYRLHAKAEKVSGSPNMIVNIRGTNVNADQNTPYRIVFGSNSGEGFVDFVADSYMKRVSLYLSSGSSTKDSVAKFSDIWVRELNTTGIDDRARNAVKLKPIATINDAVTDIPSSGSGNGKIIAAEGYKLDVYDIENVYYFKIIRKGTPVVAVAFSNTLYTAEDLPVENMVKLYETGTGEYTIASTRYKYCYVTSYSPTNPNYYSEIIINDAIKNFKYKENELTAVNDAANVVPWFPINTILAPVSGSSTMTSVGVQNIGNIVTLTGTCALSTVRILISKGFYRALNANSLRDNVGAGNILPFINGHRYAIRTRLISGSIPAGNKLYAIIRNTSHNDIANVLTSGGYTEFNWSSDSGGYMFIYGDDFANKTISDYQFSITIVDLETIMNATSNITSNIYTQVKKYEPVALAEHNLIDYGYGYQEVAKKDSASNSEVLGFKQMGQTLILNKVSDSPAAIKMRINNTIIRTYLASTIDEWSADEALELKAGTTYVVTAKTRSGVQAGTGGWTISIYRVGQHTSMASYTKRYESQNIMKTYFTAEEGEKYNIVLYIESQVQFTDYELVITLAEADEYNPKYVDEMADTIESVTELMTEPCLIFPILTDIHCNSNANTQYSFQFWDTAKNIKHFMNKINCDGVICLGDITDGGYGSSWPQSINAVAPAIDDMFDQLTANGNPIYFTMGNHDDFRYLTRGMTAPEIYKYYMRRSDRDVVYDPESYGTNYYKDFPSMKTRLICFDTNKLPTATSDGAYGISNHTLEWMTGVLNDMPQDYIGIIITHISIYYEITAASYPYNISNNTQMRAVIHNSGKNCFVVCGHSHFDISYQAENDVLVIMEGCAKAEGSTTVNMETVGGITGGVRYGRNKNDETADLWDVLVLRPFSKQLDFVRFGAGVNKHFDLS